jgi:hypothetical protein
VERFTRVIHGVGEHRAEPEAIRSTVVKARAIFNAEAVAVHGGAVAARNGYRALRDGETGFRISISESELQNG